MFNATYADAQGNAYAAERHAPLGRVGNYIVELLPEQLIPLPPGASLVLLPERGAVGISPAGAFEPLGAGCLALAALLPQGYTRLALPAFRRQDAGPLPLYGYTAVAWRDGQFYVAAKVEDEALYKWSPENYNHDDLAELVQARQSELPGNPIIQQLGHCSLEYGCFTAQNIFYRRWEGGIPVSNACNAACVGCISEQESECCPSPQSRIGYRPTAQQIVDVALPHLLQAEDAIVSFGQGCEGEPLLRSDVIAASIRQLRQQTQRGTINANTNAGYTAGVRQVVEAGIDSLRVSLNSAIPDNYRAYYRPQGYDLADVENSIRLARAAGVFVALNLLAFPGVTDREDELEALCALIQRCDVQMVQVRNLNIDPDEYLQLMQHSAGELYGLEQLADILQSAVPDLIVGSFSRPLR
ncbi:MAG: radical SAM protein [Bacillota bacterium]